MSLRSSLAEQRSSLAQSLGRNGSLLLKTFEPRESLLLHQSTDKDQIQDAFKINLNDVDRRKSKQDQSDQGPTNFLDMGDDSSDANSQTSKKSQVDHFATKEDMQVDQVKQFLAQAIGTKQYTKYSRWTYEEDEIETNIVRKQKAQIYEQLTKRMKFFNEAKETNSK